MISSFRDKTLENFMVNDVHHKKIPVSIDETVIDPEIVSNSELASLNLVVTENELK